MIYLLDKLLLQPVGLKRLSESQIQIVMLLFLLTILYLELRNINHTTYKLNALISPVFFQKNSNGAYIFRPTFFNKSNHLKFFFNHYSNALTHS